MSMRKIYRKIAKKHGVSLTQVKQDMQAAINYAYQNNSNDGITLAYQKQIPHKGKVPTPNEFVLYAAKKIKNQQK